MHSCIGIAFGGLRSGGTTVPSMSSVFHTSMEGSISLPPFLVLLQSTQKLDSSTCLLHCSGSRSAPSNHLPSLYFCSRRAEMTVLHSSCTVGRAQ